MTGLLAGIARHSRPRGAVETIERATVTLAGGIEGDYRGGVKGKPHRRQVTLMARTDWAAALAEVGLEIDWSARRVNLLVDGLDLPQTPGVRLRIGEALLEITGECDPCQRMDAIAEGLCAALTPDWRGGVCAMVIESGDIAVGDEIGIVE